MAGRTGGALARTGRLSRALCALAPGLLIALVGCEAPPPPLEGGIPLGPGEQMDAGRFAVTEDVAYEIDLECRITLPFNSEALELGGIGPGPVELEPAPSPLYTLGVETELRWASIRSEDHTTWLELASLEPVPGLGTYEQTRDAGREEAYAALRKLRPEATEMDLVQAEIREYYLGATVAFRIPPGIRTEALDLERQVGGRLVAFFISPDLPGEGVNLTLVAPLDRDDYVVKATVDDACPRLVMVRDDFFKATD